jgi:RES domain-containing protein
VDVEPIALRGVWWRHTPGHADPLYRPPHPADGRWQTGARVEALYLGATAETVWAEWYRYLAETGFPPDVSLPRELWRWQVELDDVADLSTRERLDRIGLSLPVPGRSNWAAYQRAGDGLFALGYKGLLAPSAARPEDLVLCVFRTGKGVHGATPLRPPQRFRGMPPVPRGMRT